jgi:4-hydroxybenzoate polyprenyltransferase
VNQQAATPKIKSYLSLVVFSHTIFAMPFAILGYLLGVITANASFSFTLFLLVIGCMVTARSAAMAFNRYIDRKFDAKNQRTAVREIPAGIITPKSALAFVIVSSALFVLCTYFINSICFKLSPIALLVVLGYSYTKRFTPLCHLILGVGLSLAPIGAFLAVTGYFAVQPLLFSFAVLFWVSGFDIIYALQDETFDRENSLYSIPSWLGKKAALNVSKFFHIASVGFIFLAGMYHFYAPVYYTGFGIYVLLLIYQHSIVSPTDLSRVNRAFGTTNGIASVIFVSFAILALYWKPLMHLFTGN